MISQRDRGDLARFYTVTDPRRHQKGFTIYKVTARIVSRKNPEDVQEIVTWKRYSDFKKLHRDLWQIHKNLFRQTDLFPPFAKAKLFGRFDECVIEERRQCAEDLLQFSANIPALYNSAQLEDFFKGGEVHDGSDLIGPAEPFGDFPDSLSDCSSEGEASPTRREAVKKKTAEYLMRAETISSLYLKPSSEDSMPPGAESSRPSWNLRSPAEELKAFRVLGVIDKVLLVLDTRTQETFILKGLRKSSEESGSRKTVIPRCVPNMVCLHKYIISEESVFLVLQHAEGGKLWSYLSKFLSRSTEGSFDVPLAKSSHSIEDLKSLAPCPRNSIESRESKSGNRLSVQPMHSSLTLSSQDDSSTQDDEGRESPLKWADSASSSEEECTTSYLTLCKEYGQEKIEPETLGDDPLLKLGDGNSVKDLDLMQKPLPGTFNNFSSQLKFKDLKLLKEPGQETIGQTEISDTLSSSRSSPMEFFRIDSKESASDFLGSDFVDKEYSLKSETFKPFDEDDVETQRLVIDKPSVGHHDTMSRGSNDSVPVISLKDAAVDEDSSIDEGRPDLLVNLPGAELVDVEQSSKNVYLESDIMDSKLLETPDVLQIKSSLDQIIVQPENLNLVGEYSHPSQCITLCPITVENIKELSPDPSGSDLEPIEPVFVKSSSSSISYNSSILETSQTQSKQFSDGGERSVLHDTQPPSTAGLHKELSANLMQLQIKIEDMDEVFEGRTDLREDGEIHKIFQQLDAKLSEASHFFIPESCIRRWAAEMVVALDAIHREGIVCRDLNPNNILLNDRGHIQLTYFSRWTEVEDSCDSDAVERMFCAPEIGSIAEETEACDWWSLGALLFELLTRKALVDCHPAGISTHTSLNMPEYVSKEARSLIQQLLQFNPLERLGAGVAGVEDIKSHPFFTGVDWEEFTR
ncbi:ribosomal protein S6 kinase delta-1 isoform X2 [Mixophyes fleayi]|uniref:ribosomal protein S6 kinase delta-1 isoform X2 n=1 Tax=Mixophyes fleayi TaxID=3061075 RepID=UPI003F4E1FD5